VKLDEIENVEGKDDGGVEIWDLHIRSECVSNMVAWYTCIYWFILWKKLKMGELI